MIFHSNLLVLLKCIGLLLLVTMYVMRSRDCEYSLRCVRPQTGHLQSPATKTRDSLQIRDPYLGPGVLETTDEHVMIRMILINIVILNGGEFHGERIIP